MESKTKRWSSSQTPAEPVPNAHVTFVTQADGFTVSSDGSSSSIWFFSQNHHFWSWFQDYLQGPGLNHQLVSHREQLPGFTEAAQHCSEVCVLNARTSFSLPKELFNNCSEEGREIKPQTLVLCGEATCFRQPMKILQLNPGPGITQLYKSIVW